MTVLTRRMTPESVGGRDVLFPIVMASLRGGGTASMQIRTLIDTGASFSLFPAAVGRSLGFDLSVADRVPLVGLGGKRIDARGCAVDLVLAPGKPDVIELPAARVLFVEGLGVGAAYSAILGQHDALERLTFGQTARTERPSFTLRLHER